MNRLKNIILYRLTASLLFLFILFYEEIIDLNLKLNDLLADDWEVVE